MEPLELKIFNELCQGITLYAHINIAMAYKQYALRTSLTSSTILFLHLLHLGDAVHNEVRGKTLPASTRSSLHPTAPTVMDATTDGFGDVLHMGAILWVPFTYEVGEQHPAFDQYVLDPVGTAFFVTLRVRVACHTYPPD